MASAPAGAAYRPVPSAFDEVNLSTASDEELLEQFFNQTDGTAEDAFRALVARHGPMVLGVCRHVLNQQQDAEDAFQATFLVLARKGRTIRSRNVLGRWLYEVAYRIALRARAQAMRRRVHERQASEMSPPVHENEIAWNELRPVLHDEVNRLPEKYRTPVVLCYLEGKTNEEVAQMLTWPVGTVKGRLSRARNLLRSRLLRRGLVLSAGFLLTALSESRVFAEVVPSRLLESTVRAGIRIAALPPIDGTTPDDPAMASDDVIAAIHEGVISPNVALLVHIFQKSQTVGRLVAPSYLLAGVGALLLLWGVIFGSYRWMFPANPNDRTSGFSIMAPFNFTFTSSSCPGSCH
jgi:RNA polymerase sigma factor (sigma-70 family)